jgi:hypothetical protein
MAGQRRLAAAVGGGGRLILGVRQAQGACWDSSLLNRKHTMNQLQLYTTAMDVIVRHLKYNE